VTGPTLAERQEGSLRIVLLPDGKAEFHPALRPRPELISIIRRVTTRP